MSLIVERTHIMAASPRDVPTAEWLFGELAERRVQGDRHLQFTHTAGAHPCFAGAPWTEAYPDSQVKYAERVITDLKAAAYDAVLMVNGQTEISQGGRLKHTVGPMGRLVLDHCRDGSIPVVLTERPVLEVRPNDPYPVGLAARLDDISRGTYYLDDFAAQSTLAEVTQLFPLQQMVRPAA